MVIKLIPPTHKQIEYMEILFNDCGFYRDERNAWLSNEFNRELHYLDKISKSEASIVIDKLKEIRGDSE